MSIVSNMSPATIPTKNSYTITGSEQCFGYMNNTSVQMYDLSEVLGSCITNNDGTKYNVLVIKYDGTNYTLLNEGVTSSSLITYLNNYGPVWAYLIDSFTKTCETILVSSNAINDSEVKFLFDEGAIYLSGSSIRINQPI